MAKEDLLLRETSNAPLTTKGSEFSFAELDANWIEIYNQFVALSQSSSVPAYSASVEYDNTLNNYVMHSGQLWKMVNATPQTAVTPSTDPATWVEAYPADIAHKRYTVKKSLTDAQLKGILPVTIIPKAGAGTAINVISATMRLNFGTVAFDNPTLNVRMSTLTNTDYLKQFSQMDATATEISSARTNINTQSIVENDDVVVVPNAASVLGDGTADIYLTYEIIEL